MSFILDALKKSDRKQQRPGVPDLQTVHAPAPPTGRKRPLWPWLLVAALLLNAGLLAWWLASAPDPSTSKAATLEPVPSSIQEVAPVAPSPSVTKPEPAPVAAPAPPAVAQKPPVPPLERPAAATPEPLPARRQAVDPPAFVQPAAPSEDAQPAAAAAPVVAEPRTYELDTLPAQVRSEIPEMSLSVHFYTTRAGARMARINDRIMREGDALVEGLVLEEITPEGVIFGYRGYRFRMLNLSKGRADY